MECRKSADWKPSPVGLSGDERLSSTDVGFCNCRTSAIPSRVRGDTASEPQSVASWSALRARSRVPTSGGSLASPACLAFRAEAFGFFVRPHRHCGHGLGAVSRRGARGFSGVSRRPRAVIREADRSRARVASEGVPLELTRAKSSERLHGSAGLRAKTGEGQTGSGGKRTRLDR